MAKLNIANSDETEKRFRNAVPWYKGTKKGSIREAMEEAIELWLQHLDSAVIPRSYRRS